jgi:hypothetical protein
MRARTGEGASARDTVSSGTIAPHASCSFAVLVFETRRAASLLMTATLGSGDRVACSRHGDDPPRLPFRFDVVGGIDVHVGAVHHRSQVPAREQLSDQSQVCPSVGGQRQPDAVVTDPAGRDDQGRLGSRARSVIRNAPAGLSSGRQRTNLRLPTASSPTSKCSWVCVKSSTVWSMTTSAPTTSPGRCPGHDTRR